MKYLPLFLSLLLCYCLSCSNNQENIEKWGVFEIQLNGPDDGNPFRDVKCGATFRNGETEKTVNGFYDGDGRYIIRFSPHITGQWEYITNSNDRELDQQRGSFYCSNPSGNNHGPVVVSDIFHFSYADGTPYNQIGTTCYAWVHQSDSLQDLTLKSLAKSPFNKLRMCIFPKHYTYNSNEPEYYVFKRSEDGNNDYSRFDPAFFHHFEKRLIQLKDLGIEADLILFHPYDRWGYNMMPDSVDEFYLKYIMARLSSFRNVWWSAANEFDFMDEKEMSDWHRFFQIIVENDPYERLRSIHNGRVMYEHVLPWISHASIQSTRFDEAAIWREQYRKPIIYDECRYEGNVTQGWGNLTGEEMTSMFWKSLITGTYAGHGETYQHPDDILWWAKGGTLHGDSPSRIAFFKNILDDIPVGGFEPVNSFTGGKFGEQYISYFEGMAPDSLKIDLPAGRKWRVEIIDTWNMQSEDLGIFKGNGISVLLPSKKYMAVRVSMTGFDFPAVPVEVISDGNLFLETAEVKLLHPDMESIRFTLDGSEPEESSQKYHQPILISERTVLKATSIIDGEKGEPTQVEFIPVSLIQPQNIDPQSLKPGLKYTIYQGTWQKVPDFRVLTPVKTGTVTEITLDIKPSDDYFGVWFKGYINIPEDGVYTFETISDDGSLLFIDNIKVVDNDGVHGPKRVSGQIGLKKGFHEMEIHFFENWYGEILQVSLRKKGSEVRSVDGMLFYEN